MPIPPTPEAISKKSLPMVHPLSSQSLGQRRIGKTLDGRELPRPIAFNSAVAKTMRFLQIPQRG